MPRPTVPPSVKAVNQLVGAPVESHVQLQCIVEAFPKPLNTWYRNEGIVFAVFHSSHQRHFPTHGRSPRDDGKENFHLALIFSIYWNDLNFSFFSFSSSASFRRSPQPSQLIWLNINLFRHHDPFVTIVYDQFSKIRNCIMARNILFRSRWLIRLHGKWIWRWRACTSLTLHHTSARVRMLWGNRMLASGCKVRSWGRAKGGKRKINFPTNFCALNVKVVCATLQAFYYTECNLLLAAGFNASLNKLKSS